MKKSSMNLPNTLSLIRVFLVPIFVATLLFMRNIEIWGFVVPAIVYGLTALTDMLDGKIARKYNLITDFGKFIDPLADKFMVIGSMIALLAWMLLRGEMLQSLASDAHTSKFGQMNLSDTQPDLPCFEGDFITISVSGIGVCLDYYH